MYDKVRMKSRKCPSFLHISELYVHIPDLYVQHNSVQIGSPAIFEEGKGNVLAARLFCQMTLALCFISIPILSKFTSSLPLKTLYLVTA